MNHNLPPPQWRLFSLLDLKKFQYFSKTHPLLWSYLSSAVDGWYIMSEAGGGFYKY